MGVFFCQKGGRTGAQKGNANGMCMQVNTQNLCCEQGIKKKNCYVSPLGMLHLGICRMRHRLAMSFLWLGIFCIFPEQLTVWSLHVLVWLACIF